MASVSAGHIILTPTQPVGSGRPQRESNMGPPLQESRALPQSYRAPLSALRLYVKLRVAMQLEREREMCVREGGGGGGEEEETERERAKEKIIKLALTPFPPFPSPPSPKKNVKDWSTENNRFLHKDIY